MNERAMLVTGAASGIGRHLVKELVRAGHRVAISDVDASGLDKLVDERGWRDDDRVMSCVLDVRDAAAWEATVARVVEQFGQLDVLLNVAGYLCPRWAHEITPEEIGLTIDVNVKGVMFGSGVAARHMMRRKSGQIINVASLAGLAPVPGISVYSASKHAVRGFTLALRQELKPHGVIVTVVEPDLVATPMMDVQVDHEAAALTFSGARALTVEEVVRAIVDRALVDGPAEVTVDVPWSGRAVMARLAGAMPGLADRAEPMLRKAGRRNQRRIGGR